MKYFYTNCRALTRFISPFTILGFLFCVSAFSAAAQCPPNIDFERGDFTGWQCYTGGVVDAGGTNVITLNPSPPTNNRHTMMSAVPGNGTDPYGEFPVNCPNGSAHSIKLGNNSGGHEAEGVSYQFTIPAGQNEFSLIYYYALVFQDPGHQLWQQPRLQIEITNVTDNTTIGCSSFAFIASAGLPGFFQSRFPNGATPVWCKDWSANSIDLNGMAGKTIKLFFKNADCTFTAHFGYAYIDVSTECSSSFVGATFCHDDTTVNVTAPYGYQGYKWFNSTFTQVLGTNQVLNFTPPPAPGTIVGVEVTPYSGYGCKDTLYASLVDTLTVTSAAGRDTFSCNHAPVQIGGLPKQGIVYSWSPAAGLSNPNIANPIAAPDVTTHYVVTTRSAGGGCMSTDTVVVGAAVLSNQLDVVGNVSYCTNTGDSTILKVHPPADSIQWYKNNVAIPGGRQDSSLRVTQSGVYYATLFSYAGCSTTTIQQQVTINPSPTAGFGINNTSQCLTGNQFDFTNSSTISSGTLQYSWDLGDLTNANSTDVSHSYSTAGTYIVKLTATSPAGCIDSVKKTVIIQPSPDTTLQLIGSAAFCENRGQSAVLKVLLTANIQWYKDNAAIPGATQTQYTVTQSGDYYAVLKNSNGCSLSTRVQRVDIYPTPVAALSINSSAQCFRNNQFIFTNGSTISSGPLQYSWTLGDGNTESTRDVTHNYASPGNYTVKMVVNADHGCSDSLIKQVVIYPYPKADFSLQPICMQLPLPVINKTTNNTASQLIYLWEFGNGATSTGRNPVYSYPLGGNYTVRLQVSTVQCPQTIDTMEAKVNIESLVPGINYPVQNAVYNFPLPLQARPLGISVLWSPAINLDTRGSFTPVFRGLTEQKYTIEIKTANGCITVDTQLVKTYKKVEIFVPTVFTPGNDGRNDLLRPLLMGFKEVHYFRIFDRWGKLMFEMKSDRPGWDGTVKNIPQEMQTVVWMIEAVDVDGVVHQKKGTTLLMR